MLFTEKTTIEGVKSCSFLGVVEFGKEREIEKSCSDEDILNEIEDLKSDCFRGLELKVLSLGGNAVTGLKLEITGGRGIPLLSVSLRGNVVKAV